MVDAISQMALNKDDFDRVKRMLHDYSGIFLHEGKEALVRARLMKRIRRLGMSGFPEYLQYVENDETGGEFLSLVDVLTTNKTSFFREKQHFDFLVDEVLPQMKNREFRWWSAGCSSGEEPVTLAMTLLENRHLLQNGSVKILATDLSRDMVRACKSGVYSSGKLRDLPNYFREKYFNEYAGDPDALITKPVVQNMITYGRLNLLEQWPMRGPFQVIMCRNVMIYFNRKTQMELVSRYYNLLEPGGYLFLGHSESVAGKDHGFVNIRPAVYQKRGS